MSELVIYGNTISPPVRTVMTFCKLSGIAYEFSEKFPLAGDCSTEEFRRINPFETIPSIVHKSYSLWESAAIVEYLADAYSVDNAWFPKDIKTRGRISAYLHNHNSYTRRILFGYWVRKLISPKYFGLSPLDEETEAPYKAEVKGFFEWLNGVLAEHKNVARTSDLTIADIFVHSEITLALMTPINFDEYPSVQEWYARVSAIPEVQELDRLRIETFTRITSNN